MKGFSFMDKWFHKPKEKNKEVDRILNDITMKIGEIQGKLDEISGDCDSVKELSLDDVRLVLIKLRHVVHTMKGGDRSARKEFEKIRSVW